MSFYKKNISKLPPLLFLVLFFLGFLQMIFYFIYIYLPLERIWNKNIGIPQDIPTLSSIFNSAVLVKEGPNFTDSKKNIYLDNVDLFKREIGQLGNKTEFLKTIEMSYVVSGDIYDIRRFNGNDSDKFYSLVLRNNEGMEFIEDINKKDLEDIEIYLITFSPAFSKTRISIDSISLGDYLILKRSIDALDKSMSSKLEIEVYSKN